MTHRRRNYLGEAASYLPRGIRKRIIPAVKSGREWGARGREELGAGVSRIVFGKGGGRKVKKR